MQQGVGVRAGSVALLTCSGLLLLLLLLLPRASTHSVGTHWAGSFANKPFPRPDLRLLAPLVQYTRGASATEASTTPVRSGADGSTTAIVLRHVG